MTKGKCPNCGGELVEKDSKNGTFLSCSNFPKCRFSMDYRPDYKELDLTTLTMCPNCGGELVKKNSRNGAFLSCSESLVCPDCGGKLRKIEGKYGTFLGCSNFPKCRYTRDI